MMADGKLKVEPLISHRFNLEDAADAYKIITCKEFSLGIVLKYNPDNQQVKKRSIDIWQLALKK
ncbi:hypothetical protein M1N68_00310 [Peptococcaceae bacterium]|nr:hypothetical protein [Peptococcaceae bacterium]MCL0052687.1 hypothetical protein [Peptococcaceae bacterium]MCL0063533.1 hypothetical protein [Peptococcaceae bacterium]MCL0101084.1 hypothetical protein [Peptococcaceae bacterium]